MAVSTGISFRWMQKVCYKMMDIPRIDRILPEDTQKENIGRTTESVCESIR